MTWKRGSWNAVCDVCGFEFKSDKLKLRWDKLRVCSADWETRHPMDFLRPVKESIIPWARPEPEELFTDTDYIGDDYVLADYMSPNPDPEKGYYYI